MEYKHLLIRRNSYRNLLLSTTDKIKTNERTFTVIDLF